MANNVTFNIQVTMNERWVNDFCSMLKWMERCGDIGHTSMVAFCADGDGDFRPKFKIDREFYKTKGIWKEPGVVLPCPEVLFDAG